jgi:hypothetical protein
MDILWCKGRIYALEHYLPTADSLFHFYVCICPDEAFQKKEHHVCYILPVKSFKLRDSLKMNRLIPATF